MKYQVGDKVLVEAEITFVDTNPTMFPYKAKSSYSVNVWLSDKDIVKAEAREITPHVTECLCYDDF